jgi:trehalose 6-phosphate phosphatase
LADFAPTPDHVAPDPKIIELVNELAKHPRIRAAVISGRRLDQVEKLIPVRGLPLAGTYGVELLLPNEERLDRVPYENVRPVLARIKPRWEELISDREGFFLEDKDWALAIHARYADGDVADEVLVNARRVASRTLEEASRDLFRVLGGHKFLEVGPALAHKGCTVDFLLDRHPWAGALLLYVGDDDKDEEAFDVIHAHEGIAIKVCEQPCDTKADGRLETPQEVRRWLATLGASLSDGGTSRSGR